MRLHALLLVLAAVAVVHVLSTSPTFGQMAQQTSVGKFAKMVALLPSLNASSMPKGDLGPLRDSLIMIRDVLDVFPFTYPTPSNGGQDVYRLLRTDLNYAYTGIGDYMDLHTVNYSTVIQEKMLDDLLAWKLAFENRTILYKYDVYFDTPDASRFYYRNDSELSLMFWGNSTIQPDPSQSGGYNLALLAIAQNQHHVERFYVLTTFANLSTIYNGNFMHDYKKQLRAMKRVALDWFPGIMNSTSITYKGLITQINACHTMLGQTHSFVVPFLYYAQHGPGDLLAESEIALDEAYVKMKDWLFTNAWLDYLHLWKVLLIV